MRNFDYQQIKIKMEWTILIIFCLVVLSIFLIWLFISLRKKKYDIKKALCEPTGEESSSRLLLFISGVSAVIFSYVFVGFYIYAWLELPDCCSGKNCKQLPDFGGLINGLIALGIGVIPYSVNKVSTALASAKSTLHNSKTKPIKLMKTIMYNVEIRNGHGQLAVSVAGKPTLRFTQSGRDSHDLPVGDHTITVAATPPSSDGGEIKFQIWNGDRKLSEYTFSEPQVVDFNIKVD